MKSQVIKSRCYHLILLVIFCLISSPVVKAQNESVSEQKGYLIHLLGGWCFQPCSDSTIELWDALNGNSFRPGTFARTYGSRLLPLSLSDSPGKVIFSRFVFQGRMLEDSIYYFYCKIKLKFYDESLTNVAMDTCNYILFHDERKYGLYCKYYSNTLEDIEPVSYNDKIKYIAFLKRNNISPPDWVEQFVRVEQLN